MKWQKASASGANGQCVEIAFPGEVWIRDSKNPAGGHLAVSTQAWQRFVADLKRQP